MSIRAAFLADRDCVRARHPAPFATNYRARATSVLLLGGAAALWIASLVALGISPLTIVHGLGRLGDIAAMMLPPNPETWSLFVTYLGALGQTLATAFLGTLLGAVLATPLGFLAAHTVVANRILHFVTRRGLDSLRSIDTLVWALIWINVVGLGPFAGALAIASTDIGAFGKLLSEAIETADDKPCEGVIAAGGTWLQSIRFGVVPQVLPIYASQVLYFFESNTRSATILGIVGAGGIGLYLSEQIRVLEWKQASFLILMVLVTVAGIDAISQRLRAAILGRARD